MGTDLSTHWPVSQEAERERGVGQTPGAGQGGQQQTSTVFTTSSDQEVGDALVHGACCRGDGKPHLHGAGS